MTRITMCIIDDVKSVVDGLMKMIPWSEHRIDIVGTAKDGREGLQLLHDKRPHIVLTDIRMPMLGGIDMIRDLRNADDGQTKVIFFSGYSDFTCAQESVRLGAFDYLVKPFTRQQILETVLRAKEQIEGERLEHHNRLELERKLRESMPYLQQEYFQLLIRHDELQKHASEKWEFFGIELETERFIAMIVQMDNLLNENVSMSVRDVELARYAVQNILEETLGKYTKAIVFREHPSQFVVLMNPSSTIEAMELAEVCQRNVRQYAKIDISIGVGGRVEEMKDIPNSYNQAKTALSYQFYFGSSCIISYSDIERQGKIVPHYSAEKETELLYCLRSGNQEGVERLLDEICEECLRYPNPPEPEVISHLFYGLAFSIYRVIAEKADNQQRLWLDEQLVAIKKGNHLSTNELVADVKKLGKTGCDWMQSRQKNSVSRLIHQALAYIDDHLGSDLTVQECAGAVHLSPSYFSSLFKKEMGVTFMQYVTSARMEKAKNLLVEGMQVQDITFELGYRDRPYFTELFKKHTGLTPTEFRCKYEGNLVE